MSRAYQAGIIPWLESTIRFVSRLPVGHLAVAKARTTRRIYSADGRVCTPHDQFMCWQRCHF